MRPAVSRVLVACGALLVLVVVNASIYGKERIVRSGEPIFLELVPVDPRSLMQGDYMALRFRLAEQIEAQIEASEGFRAAGAARRSAPLAVDARRVATFGAAAGVEGLRIGYRLRNGRVWLGTNAYFFEEGSAERYVEARYGEFRLDPDSGDAVLVGLADENLERL